MDNSIYVMLSRQTALFRKMNVVANNIANIDTTGYQAEKVMFDDYLAKDSDRQKVAYVQDVSSYRDTGQGNMRVTHGALDAAISGDGYFTIETPQGERYTRAGNWQIDGEGTLVTSEGYPVMDDSGGRIEFASVDKNITIGEAGNISVDGEERATLGVVEFENQQKLVQEGSRILRANEEPLPAENSRVLHGVLEKSNVKPIEQIVNLTKISKAVGSTAKFIEVAYELQRKAHSAYTKQSN